MRSVSVAIVSPIHNRRDETLRCLRSLMDSNRSGVSFRIIIVDDGSTDGSAEAIALEFPEVELLSGDGNLWYTSGTNRGIEAALKSNPKYILAINDDSVFDPNCIKALVECAEGNPGSVIGPLLLNREAPQKVFQVSPNWDFWMGGMRHWNKQTVDSVPDEPWDVELIAGNCVLYPADAIRDVGLMDEKHLPQYGDAEYTPRMRRKGWRLLIKPQARVYCKPNDENSGFRSLPLREKFNQLLFRPTGPYSLNRRIYANLGAAPNPVAGILSVPVFYGRVLLGLNAEGQWGAKQSELPLKEMVAESFVNDPTP